MSKIPIIVGLDPGTTSAYAILGINGELIEAYSSKEMGLGEIIDKVVRKGLPIIAATDKSKAPDLIEQFAAKTGSKIFTPKYDLKTEEKNKIAKGFSFDDAHQMDALASALYAYNNFINTITKIKKFARELSKENILDEMIIYVIKEGISVRAAIRLIEGQDEEIKIVRKVINERNFGKKDFLELYDKLNETERESALLRKYNSELRNRLAKLESDISILRLHKTKKEAINSKKIDGLFVFKEKRIEEMNRKVDDKENEIRELREEIKKANRFISDLNNVYLLKKIRNLGINEFEAKKNALNILEGDLLFVDDPNVYHEKTLGQIKDKVKIIAYKTKPTRKTINELPFSFISYEDIKIVEFGDFAYAAKEQIDKRIQKKDILHNIIEEYKESRK